MARPLRIRETENADVEQPAGLLATVPHRLLANEMRAQMRALTDIPNQVRAAARRKAKALE